MKATLPVVESFHSLQGEGAHTGRSAFFIRLASCTVGCPWCDTKQSWSENIHPQINLTNLSKDAAHARSNGASFVVITGGEPLHHDLSALSREIRTITSCNGQQPMPIHIETSGVDQISGTPNWITLSPKRHAPPRLELLHICNELKVVVHENSDLCFAEEMAKEMSKRESESQASNKQKNNSTEKPLLFLQPGWNNEEGQKLAYQYVIKNPQWRLSMQTHKWLGVL